jgi:hypothetical protein
MVQQSSTQRSWMGSSSSTQPGAANQYPSSSLRRKAPSVQSPWILTEISPLVFHPRGGGVSHL